MLLIQKVQLFQVFRGRTDQNAIPFFVHCVQIYQFTISVNTANNMQLMHLAQLELKAKTASGIFLLLTISVNSMYSVYALISYLLTSSFMSGLLCDF